jgi:hypothetical protein
MTMLEKAARAMCVRGWGRDDVSEAEWDAASEYWLPVARAALVAIREPDDAMLAPACKTHKPGEPMSEARPYECPSITRRRARFTAMIDAILEGEA